MLKFILRRLRGRRGARRAFIFLLNIAHRSWLTHAIRRSSGLLPEPDLHFPLLVNLEAASVCNLRCVHCPPHEAGRTGKVRRLGFMDMKVFSGLMDEVDEVGPRRISLHKDGEPLLHPQFMDILQRTKLHQEHNVYLSTNAHKFDENIARACLEHRIDILNFSIGAANADSYARIRGKGFDRVIRNIEYFLAMRAKHSWKPRVIAQIIDLPEVPSMRKEIAAFKRYWHARGVEVQVWEKLNWGIYNNLSIRSKRYPCYSLWESFTVNSDGLVSACCVDWQQKLVIGDAKKQTIYDIWHNHSLRELRRLHMEKRERELRPCSTCNYWSWHPRLTIYRLDQ